MSSTFSVNRWENSTNALIDVGLLKNLLSTDSKNVRINIIMYKIKWIILINQKDNMKYANIIIDNMLFNMKKNEREKVNYINERENVNYTKYEN